MGCYDSILLPCPKCGELYEAQSKSGDCLLRVFDFDKTPSDVMKNVNRHAPFTCFNCGEIFHVEFNPTPKTVEFTDAISDDFPAPLENSSKEEIRRSFEEYISKLDKK